MVATDQLDAQCPEHRSPASFCFCDEKRDRAQGIHRCGTTGNMFGGYDCICGAPWLNQRQVCMDAPDFREQFAPSLAKRWFNRRWPYSRRCAAAWCWRGQTYQYRCYVHNRTEARRG